MELKNTTFNTGSEGPKGQGNDRKKDAKEWKEHIFVKMEKYKPLIW